MKILLFLLNLPIRFCYRLDRWFCCSLPRPLRFWWAKQWVRKDEFHPSLNLDADYASRLSQEERDAYFENVMKRRAIAHERDIATS